MINATPVTTAMHALVKRAIPAEMLAHGFPLGYLLDLYAMPVSATKICEVLRERHILAYARHASQVEEVDTCKRIELELDAIDDTMRFGDVSSRALTNDLWHRFYPDKHPDPQYKSAAATTAQDFRQHITWRPPMRPMTIEWFYMGCAMLAEPQVVAALEQKHAASLQTDLCDHIYGRLFRLIGAVMFDDVHGDPTVLQALGCTGAKSIYVPR